MSAAPASATHAETSSGRSFALGASYGYREREPEETVNFVACLDGFTVNDLVSCHQKRNEANGEGNRDGSDDRRGWNCGVEGPSDDRAVEQLWNRQVENFLTVAMLSPGIPRIGMGDETRRSQLGNNNACCQDNPASWLDWTLLDRHADVHRFARLLIEERLLRDRKTEQRPVSLNQLPASARKDWHGVKLGQPDWSPSSHSIALSAHLPQEHATYYVILNEFWEPLKFELPNTNCGSWKRWVDASLDSPDDIAPWRTAPSIPGGAYTAGPCSVVVPYAEVSE